MLTSLVINIDRVILDLGLLKNLITIYQPFLNINDNLYMDAPNFFIYKSEQDTYQLGCFAVFIQIAAKTLLVPTRAVKHTMKL